MQIVYEGQTVCLFGKLVYDIESDSFNFNDVIGLYRGDKQHDMVEIFKSDRFWDVLSIFKWSAVLVSVGWLTLKIGSFVWTWQRERRQRQKLEALEKKLREEDDSSRIKDAP
jgi:hypothetical protein